MNGLVLIAFSTDSVIQRIRRQFKDPRAQSNLDRVNAELQDVRQIMHRNISEIMVRGEALDGMSTCSVSMSAFADILRVRSGLCK